MTILNNLIQYSPDKNGFNTYIRDVNPAVKGVRIIFSEGKLRVESNSKKLPNNLELKNYFKLFHRYSLSQFGINMKKVLKKSGFNLNDLNCIYCPISDYIFQLKEVPQIITCHDLTPLFFSTSFRQKFRFKYIMPNYFKSAQKIIAISKFAADQLIDIGIESSKIKIIYNGIKIKRPKINSQKSSDILVIARHDLNKNVEYIVNSFIKLVNRNINWEGKLVIVGKPGRQTKKIKTICKDFDDKKIIFMQDISEAKLVNLIRNSMVLISSSYMEGFNYTILEAIAEGLPTLVSDIDVHREIYDNSSMFFSLKDQGEELIECIYDIHKNHSIWNELSKKGYELSKTMTLKNKRRSIVELLENYK